MENKAISDIIYREIDFSDDELKELELAAEMPIVFDDDCPEITPEQAKKFRRVNPRKSVS